MKASNTKEDVNEKAEEAKGEMAKDLKKEKKAKDAKKK
jgi:hypothetical protein